MLLQSKFVKAQWKTRRLYHHHTIIPYPTQKYMVYSRLCAVLSHSGGHTEFMNLTPAIQLIAKVMPCINSSGSIHLHEVNDGVLQLHV